MMRTAVFRLCGQVSLGPSGVADQSRSRIIALISPGPDRKSQSRVDEKAPEVMTVLRCSVRLAARSLEPRL